MSTLSRDINWQWSDDTSRYEPRTEKAARDAEMDCYLNRPQQYAATELLVDVCVAHFRKKCVGGECDERVRCERHERTPDIARRYARLRQARRR